MVVSAPYYVQLLFIYTLPLLQVNAGESVVAVDLESRKKKLSKDLLYLFNKLSVWQMDMNELADRYEECFHSPLEPHLYGCSSVTELMKCKYINQVLEVMNLPLVLM